MRVRGGTQTLFVTFAEGDLPLVRPAAEQIRQAGSAIALDLSHHAEPFASVSAGYIRASLEIRIKHCAATLCLFGTETLGDAWVRWTLQTAQRLGRPLLGAPLEAATHADIALLSAAGAEIVSLDARAMHRHLFRRVSPERSASPAPPDLTFWLMRHNLR